MKKLLGMAALILSVVVFAYTFRLEAVAYLLTSVRAVENKQIASVLKNGADGDGKDSIMELGYCEAGEPVYRRGNQYYLGEKKTSLDITYPFYTNEGTALYFMNDKMKVVASDFASFETYDGLYVSNGASYDDTFRRADEEEYIMLSLSGGLYMNVQPMTVSSTGDSSQIKMNSILYLGDDVVRAYSYEEDMLVYHETKVMSTSKVQIGSVSMDYAEFLKDLGLDNDGMGIDIRPVDREEETVPDTTEIDSGSAAAGHSSTSNTEIGENAADSANSASADGNGSGTGEGLSDRENNGGAAGSDNAADDQAALNENDETGDGGEDASQQENGEDAGDKNQANSGNDEKATSQNNSSSSAGGSSSGNTSGGSGMAGTGTSTSGSGNGGGGGSVGSGSGSGSGGSGSGGGSSSGGSGSSGSGSSSSSSSSSNGGGTAGGDGANVTPGGNTGGSGSGSGDGTSGGGNQAGGNGGNSGSGSGSGNNSGTIGGDHGSGGSGTGSGTGGDSGSGSGTDGGSDNPGDNPEEVYTEPTASLSNITMGVYTMRGTLSIEDPQNRVVRAVIRLYINGKQSTRRNLRSAMDFSMANVRPDTTYEVKCELVFRNASGVRETKQFMDSFEVKSFPISTLGKLTLDFGDADEYLPRKITIPDMTLTGPEADEAGERLLDYASKIIFTSGKQELTISGSFMRKLREGGTGEWTSEEVFSSNGTYPFTLDVEDRYGNSLPLTEGSDGTVTSRTEGVGHTSCITPTATITEENNQVGRQQIGVRIVNPDNVSMDNSYLMVLNTDNQPLAAFSKQGDDENSCYRRPVTTTTNSKQHFDIDMLPSGLTCRVVVVSDFDIKDKPQANMRKEEEIGRIALYTAPISRLGYAYVNINELDGTTADTFAVRTYVNTSKTVEGLRELMTAMPIKIATQDGNVVYSGLALDGKTQIFGKAYMEKIKVSDTMSSVSIASGSDALKVPTVTLQDIPDGSTNAWDAYMNGAKAVIRFPKGSFTSKTTYTVTVAATATQGGSDYEVGATTNKLNIMTLKAPATIVNDEEFTISDFYELYGFEIVDRDGSIPGETVLMRLWSQGSMVSSQTLMTNHLYEKLRFDRLKENTSYQIEFVTPLYNEGYTSETQELNYKLDKTYAFTTGEGITGSIEMKDLTPVKNSTSNEMEAVMKSEISDRKSELAEGKYSVKLYGAAGIDTSDSRLTLQTTFEDVITSTDRLNHQAEFTYVSKFNWKYRADLVVSVRGYEIVLDSAKYTTEEEMDTISSWSEFVSKLRAAESDKYIVTADLVKNTDDSPNTSAKIDFQGHKVTVVNNKVSPMVNWLYKGGVIENLEVDFNAETVSEAKFRAAAVVNWNQGTVRNAIVNINWSGRYSHTSFGGIVQTNYGGAVVENFVVRLMNELYVGNNAGGACYNNAGTVRNGYITSGSSGSVSGITVGSGVYGGSYSSRSSVGGIVGSNSGLVDNVFSLINLSIEDGSSMDSVGGAVGYNSGTVRDSFFVGDIYTFGFNADKAQTASTIYRVGGGIVGSKASAGQVKNLYNFSMQTDPADASKPMDYGVNSKGTRDRIYATTGEIQRLWDTVWYDGVLTNTDQFLVEDLVGSGYYPKVVLPDAIMPDQESVSLPAAPAVNAPEYVSGTVLSQTSNTAEMTLYFRNPNLYEIKEIVADDLTIQILDQKSAGNFYEVHAKILNPQHYRSQYLLQRVVYIRSQAGLTGYTEYGSKKPAYLDVSFYKEIATVGQWAAIRQDLESNYIVTRDIDFSKASTDDMVILGNFKGQIDGGGYTLSNLAPGGNYSYIFEKMTRATVTDLNVENMTLDVNDSSAAKSKALYAGFVGQADETTLKNIFLKNVAMNGMPGATGALVGEMTTNGEVTDCRAENVQIVTASYTGSALKTGGLIGKAANVTVSSCYVSGLDMTAMNGVSADGIGGLAGVLTGNSKVDNAYTQGSLSSAFGRTGGAVGSAAYDLNHIWTYVNINCNMPMIGGVLGCATRSMTLSGCLVMGDIATTATSDVGRTYGGISTGSVELSTANLAAYSGQVVGKAATTELMGVNVLCDGNALATIVPYRDQARIGEGFDLAGASGYKIEDGYMPQLYMSDGTTIFTPQQPVTRRDERLTINDIQLRESTDQAAGKTTYNLLINVSTGDSPYDPMKVTCGDLEIGELAISKNDSTGQWTISAEVSIIHYLSQYQISVGFAPAGSTEAVQTITGQLTSNLSRKIANVEQWVQVMQNAGQNYENFEITGDIDLSGLTQKQLQNGLMNLKINSIKGNGVQKIHGLNYRTQSNGESMIAALSGTMENLVFEDMTINNSGLSGNYIALIGQNQGTIQNVTFRKININGNSGSYIGCVGMNTGSLNNITLEDLTIAGSEQSGSYVGGLVGMNSGEMKSITATANLGKTYTYQQFKNGATIGSAKRYTPVKSDYSFTVTGRQYVGGIVGYSKADFSDITVKSVYVYAKSGISGGVAGCVDMVTVKDVVVGDEEDKVLPVMLESGGSQNGGVYGLASNGVEGGTRYLDNALVSHSFIIGAGYTGGVGGNNNWYHMQVRDSKVEFCTITATGERVGGVSAYGRVERSEVRGCEIRGTNYVGGIGGSTGNTVMQSAVIDSTITGTKYVGGVMGASTVGAGVPTNCVVSGCTVTGTTGSSESIGGAVGLSTNGTSWIYITDTTVSGENRVGGAIGTARGGTYSYINTNAVVKGSTDVGCFTGVLYDYDNNTSRTYSNRLTTIHDVTVGGSAIAAAYGSTFAGRMTYTPATRDMSGKVTVKGNNFLTSGRYYNITLMGTVTCTATAGTTSSETTMSRWAYFTLALNESNYTISAAQADDYSRDGLIDTVTSNGSTDMRTAVWKGVRVLRADGTEILPLVDAKYQDYGTATAAQKKQVVCQISYADLKNASYWNTRNVYDDSNHSLNAAISAGHVPYQKPTTAMFGGAMMRDYENASIKGTDDDALGVFPLPTDDGTSAQISTMSLTDDPDLVTTYASGVDTLNIELAAGLEGAQLSVLDGAGTVLTAIVDRRVYTMSYDFSAPLTVTLSDGERTESYDVDPAATARTVMTDGGSYYYLTSAGIRGSSGNPAPAETETAAETDGSEKELKNQRLVEGSFLHLYGGKALDTSGNIWNVESGKIIGKADFTNADWQETKSLGTYRYGGYALNTYGKFTESKSSKDETVYLDSQAYVKGGKLYAVDASFGAKTGEVLADAYNGNRYLTVLGEDGMLLDVETPINMPEKFKNMGIHELAGNLDSSSRIAIVRYDDGTVAAFNYLTGTAEILVEDTYFDTGTDTSFADFAADWVTSKIDSWFGFSNAGYEGSLKQISSYETSGISAAIGQLASGSKNNTDATDGGTAVGKPGSSDENAGNADVSGTADGSDTGQAGSDNSDAEDSFDGSGTEDTVDGEADDNGSADISGDVLNDSGNAADQGGTEEGAADGEDGSDGENVSDDNVDQNDSGSGKDGNGTSEKDGTGDGKDASDETSGDKKATGQQSKGEKAVGEHSGSETEDQTDAENGNAGQKDRAESNGEASGKTQGSEAGSDGETVSGESTSGEQIQAVSGQTGDDSADQAAGGSDGTQDEKQAGSTGKQTDGSETGLKSGADNSADGNYQNTGALVNAGLSENGQETGLADGENSMTEGTGSNNADSASAEGTAEGNGTAAGDGSDAGEESAAGSMISVYDAKSGEYKIYDVDEFLSAPKAELTTVDEKVRMLSAQGVITYQNNADGNSGLDSRNKRGLIVFGATAAAIVMLLVYLADRRRRHM